MKNLTIVIASPVDPTRQMTMAPGDHVEIRDSIGQVLEVTYLAEGKIYLDVLRMTRADCEVVFLEQKSKKGRKGGC